MAAVKKIGGGPSAFCSAFFDKKENSK